MSLGEQDSARLVADLAQRFVTSWRVTIWDHVTADLRGAMIDSLIVEALRHAQAAGGGFLISPSAVLEWRRLLVEQLAAGIYQGKRRRTFMIEYTDQ